MTPQMHPTRKSRRTAPRRFRARLGPALLCAFALAFGLRAEPAARSRGGAPPAQRDRYGLHANDLVEIKVFQEDDLQSTLRISKEGTVNFPLIGVVRIGGQTSQDAARAIRERLARGYLVNPQVSVTVKEYSKRRFTVLGEVQKPGAYDMPDRDSIGLLEAIGMAGGYTRIAEPARIILKRTGSGGETVFKLNAKKMARDHDGRSFEIQPGDVVTVGESLF